MRVAKKLTWDDKDTWVQPNCIVHSNRVLVQIYSLFKKISRHAVDKGQIFLSLTSIVEDIHNIYIFK